ncbi:helix-turn-helix transcriptional regulator [Ideonella azotifigens]|uniref:HTH hxlR-type domain-containing protein n=1 Tax=Ideonella azotifigens TaxID=513160 RepID=A0ABN1KGB2_9BURK|nr:helix-turn-helix domain-containing protein [Ideonella azotifigens]MCD2340431.1 helix-turn-helix transcriptional regulator [Ideonella azotifigens]
MTTIKERSSVQKNKQAVLEVCPVTYVMERIGGYWKPVILYELSFGEMRYSELRRRMPGISEKVLIQQLKQLEADGLLTREARPVVPPHVTYSLTLAGRDMLPVMRAMVDWAEKYIFTSDAKSTRVDLTPGNSERSQTTADFRSEKILDTARTFDSGGDPGRFS